MKNVIKTIGFITFSALIFSACTAPEKVETLDLEKIKVEIQAMEDAYAAAEKVKDADGVAVYYSEEAINYAQNKEPNSGRAAIRKNIASNMAKDTLGNYNVYKIVDLFAEGNIAIEIGSWTEFDASGKELEHGNYMSYFEKRDGKYVCVRDMSTTTAPVKSGM